jgi:hypothetical protein
MFLHGQSLGPAHADQIKGFEGVFNALDLFGLWFVTEFDLELINTICGFG